MGGAEGSPQGKTASGGLVPTAVSPPNVSVVIPTWQRALWLDRCLAAVGGQKCRPNEVIVVGRAQDTAARARVEARANEVDFAIRWLEVERPGHVPPVRRGLEAASSDIVAFLDDDAEPEPDWLEALLGPFQDARVACVGGRVMTPGSKGKVRADAGRVRWYGKHVGNIGALDMPSPIDVDGVMEGNWAWRAEILRLIPFDSAFEFDDSSMYGLDLCLQAKARGYRVVYQSSARIIHHAAPRDPSLDRHDRPRRVRAYSRNYTYLALKHFRGTRRAAFWIWWWLVGERGSYGVIAGVVDLVRRRTAAPALIRASLVGKREGVVAWRRA